MSTAMSDAHEQYQRQSPMVRIAIPVAIVMTILVIAMWAGFVPEHMKAAPAVIPAPLGSMQDVIRASFNQIQQPNATYRPVPQGNRYVANGNKQQYHPHGSAYHGQGDGHYYRQGVVNPHYNRAGANSEYDLSRVMGANSEIDIYSRLRGQGANSEIDIMSNRGPRPMGANSEIDILSNRGPQGASGIGGVSLDVAYKANYHSQDSADVPDTRVGAPVYSSNEEMDAQLITDTYGAAYDPKKANSMDDNPLSS
jgi:hypothetical protein